MDFSFGAPEILLDKATRPTVTGADDGDAGSGAGGE